MTNESSESETAAILADPETMAALHEALIETGRPLVAKMMIDNSTSLRDRLDAATEIDEAQSKFDNATGSKVDFLSNRGPFEPTALNDEQAVRVLAFQQAEQILRLSRPVPLSGAIPAAQIIMLGTAILGE